MTMKNLSIIFLAILLISCNKYEKEEATINYYLTATSDTTYSRIFFQFDATRAHRKQNSEVRSVYLDYRPVGFNLGNPEELFMGSSTVEAENIDGYSFLLEEFSVVRGNDTLELVRPYGYRGYTAFPISLSDGEELNVTFTLDVEASVVLDSAGQNWIKPQMRIEN